MLWKAVAPWLALIAVLILLGYGIGAVLSPGLHTSSSGPPPVADLVVLPNYIVAKNSTACSAASGAWVCTVSLIETEESNVPIQWFVPVPSFVKVSPQQGQLTPGNASAIVITASLNHLGTDVFHFEGGTQWATLYLHFGP